MTSTAMNRRGILQNILSISLAGRADAAARTGQPEPPPEPPRCPIPALPKLALPKIQPVLKRLKKSGVPKRSAEKMSKAYREGSQAAIRSTTTELRQFWTRIIRKNPKGTEDATRKFNTFASVIVPQLTQALEDRFNLVLSIAEEHLILHPPPPKPKWDKQWVPLFVWVFASPHGMGKYPTYSQKQLIANRTKLSYRQITVWFQNRRARTKKKIAEGKPVPLNRGSLRDYHWTDDLPPEERKAAIKTILGQRLGSLPSLVEQHEERTRDEYRTGLRVNVLEACEAPTHSFPQPMKDRSYPIPEFEMPQWPRSSPAFDTGFLPVRSRDVKFLADQLQVIHVTPPEEDSDVVDIVKICDTLDLDPERDDDDSDYEEDSDSDSESGSGSDSDSDGEEEVSDATVDLNADDPETVVDTPDSEAKAKASVGSLSLDSSVTPDSATRPAEESLRILQRGVGKVPLMRTYPARPSTNMPPPAPPPRRKMAVCRNVFNGRPKSIPKKKLPIIRELPNPMSITIEEVMAEAQEETQNELHYLIDEILQADSDAQDSVCGDEVEYDVEEHWEEDPDSQDEMQVEESAIKLISSIADMEGFSHLPHNYDCDVSIDDSEESVSGSSHFASEIGDMVMTYNSMENVNLSVLELHEVLEPPRDLGVPECFKIPFDPEIAQVALKMTLDQLGITPNFAQPITEASNCFESFKHLLPEIPQVEDTDHLGTIDIIALSNAVTDSFYAPSAVVDLGVARPTYLEQYQATLPIWSEDMDYPGPEYNCANEELQLDDLEFLSSENGPPDLAFLSSITHVPETEIAVSAVFATEESEFPEEYGDGSQYLVLDPAYDLTEFEQQVYRFPSYLPPGGIPSDRYSYPEPPPLESYSRPLREECRIFVWHGPTQIVNVPPLRPVLPPSPPIIIPAPPQHYSLPEPPKKRSIFPTPHLPPTSSGGSDGTEASRRNVLLAGLSSLMSMITSAPGYILRGSTPEPPPPSIEDVAPMSWEEPRPPPVMSIEEELGMETRSTWPTLPLLEEILDLF